MNLPSIKPQNLIAAAALLAPIVLVQTVRLVFGGGPGQASAMIAQGDMPAGALAPAPASTGTPAPIVTPKQKAAVEHLKALRSEITIYTSPFNHLQPKGSVMSSTTPTIEQTPVIEGQETRPTELPPEVRSLSLGALMMNEHGPFAVVSGRVRIVGEVVLPGWTVTAIDTETRKVTITSDEGVSVTLTQSR